MVIQRVFMFLALLLEISTLINLALMFWSDHLLDLINGLFRHAPVTSGVLSLLVSKSRGHISALTNYIRDTTSLILLNTFAWHFYLLLLLVQNNMRPWRLNWRINRLTSCFTFQNCRIHKRCRTRSRLQKLREMVMLFLFHLLFNPWWLLIKRTSWRILGSILWHVVQMVVFMILRNLLLETGSMIFELLLIIMRRTGPLMWLGLLRIAVVLIHGMLVLIVDGVARIGSLPTLNMLVSFKYLMLLVLIHWLPQKLNLITFDFLNSWKNFRKIKTN